MEKTYLIEFAQNGTVVRSTVGDAERKTLYKDNEYERKQLRYELGAAIMEAVQALSAPSVRVRLSVDEWEGGDDDGWPPVDGVAATYDDGYLTLKW